MVTIRTGGEELLWIMFHHACQTTKVYVVATADNINFRTVLSSAVNRVGVPLQIATQTTYGDDRWMQDAMEPGFSSLPKTGAVDARNLPATLRTANDRQAMGWGPTDGYPKNELLGPDYGFTQATTPTTGTSLDSFGNLECSPPFVHSGSGRHYKFGRIVYGGGGRVMHAKVRQFLAAQKLQEPFEIDTDWLVVGHVDEVMSFLPLPAARKGFKVMTASPKMALDIVQAAPNTARLLHGIYLTPGKTAADIAAAYPLSTAGAIKGDAAFRTVQSTVQGKIDAIKLTLKSNLDLQDTDFIDLPVLFKEEGGRYVAYTPDVVNMLVITKSPSNLVLCVPKPFGPIVRRRCQFETKVRSQLALPGVTIHFIDDFMTYHMLFGEIHCGTNSQRKPPTDRWWWELDWI
jgi:protein-arginine deiminase